jgi:hypothetical protein
MNAEACKLQTDNITTQQAIKKENLVLLLAFAEN